MIEIMTVSNRLSIETNTNVADTLEGNFEMTGGVSGKGLRLDGFTPDETEFRLLIMINIKSIL